MANEKFDELYNLFRLLEYENPEVNESGFWGRYFILTSNIKNCPIISNTFRNNPIHGGCVLADTKDGLFQPTHGGPISLTGQDGQYKNESVPIVMADILEVPHNLIIPFAQLIQKKLNTSPMQGSPFGILLKQAWCNG